MTTSASLRIIAMVLVLRSLALADLRLFVANNTDEEIDFVSVSWMEKEPADAANTLAWNLKEATFVTFQKRSIKEIVLGAVGTAVLKGIWFVRSDGTYFRKTWSEAKGQPTISSPTKVLLDRLQIQVADQQDLISPSALGYPVLNISVGDLLEPDSAASGTVNAKIMKNLTKENLQFTSSALLHIRSGSRSPDWRTQQIWLYAYRRAFLSCVLSQQTIEKVSLIDAMATLYPEHKKLLMDPFLAPTQLTSELRKLFSLCDQARQSAIDDFKQMPSIK